MHKAGKPGDIANLDYPHLLLPAPNAYFHNLVTGLVNTFNRTKQSIDRNNKLPANLAGKSHCDTVESIKTKLFDAVLAQVPSTLIRFQTKTELFCSGYGYRPHYNAENDHRKRSHSKTLDLKTMLFENAAFWCRSVVWME